MAQYGSFIFSISPTNEYSGSVSFWVDWFDLFAVQGILKSLLQHHSSKASILLVFSLLYDTTLRNAVLGCTLKNDRMISVCFQGKPFNLTVIQVYAPTSNTEKAEVEQFYEDLQDLLELTPKKDVLFIIEAWNEKVGSQETPGVTGKFGLGIQDEAGQKLIEFCQENALVIANTVFQQHKRKLYTWTSPDGQHRN